MTFFGNHILLAPYTIRCLSLTIAAIICLHAAASELQAQELGHFLRDSFSEENTSNVTDPFSHDAGWLGKRFLKVIVVPNTHGYVDGLVEGAQLQVNFPAPWSDDLFATVSQDFQIAGSISYRKAQINVIGDNIGNLERTIVATEDRAGGFRTGDTILSDAFDSPTRSATTNGFRSLEEGLEAYNLFLGSTFYVSSIDSIRPFTQIGYLYSSVETPVFGYTLAASNPRAGMFPRPAIATLRRSYHNFILNPGIEYDITNRLAIRGTAHLDTRHALKNTFYSGDLIIWPKNRWFINIGGRFFPTYDHEQLTIGTGFTL